MAKGFLTESAFLTRMALQAYNTQFGRNIRPEDCTIRSIKPHYSRTLGYEISTKRQDDFLRIKVFLDIGRGDQVHQYRVENDAIVREGNLEDEVFVAVGTVSQTYIDQGLYKFRWIGPETAFDNRIFDSDGNPLEWTDGFQAEWTTEP